MTKQEQIEEMAKIVDEMYNVYTTTADDIADGLYNAGYRKIQDGTVVLTNEEYDKLGLFEETVQEYKSDNGQLVLVKEQKKLQKYSTDIADFIRKETAKEIFQKVVNICRKEEDFQDGTVNTQLEPLYFGIMNGCAFIRGEVKELAKQYGVEVEE